MTSLVKVAGNLIKFHPVFIISRFPTLQYVWHKHDFILACSRLIEIFKKSSALIFPHNSALRVSSSVQLRRAMCDNKMKGKKKKRKDKKSNKGASTENSGRNGKILFFHSSRGRRRRDEVRAVFSEKIHHPRQPPPPAACRSVFFPPLYSPFPIHRRYILLPMANAGLANFETKTSAESKTKLVLRLFAIAKQGRCKTTIKTLVWGWKITFHQSHRYFSVCYIAS